MIRPGSNPSFFLAVSALCLAVTALPAAAEEAPAPDWGAFGVQTRWMDREVKPGDDFDGYVNGVWNRTVEIPADKTEIGAFIELRDISQKRLKAIRTPTLMMPGNNDIHPRSVAEQVHRLISHADTSRLQYVL